MAKGSDWHKSCHREWSHEPCANILRTILYLSFLIWVGINRSCTNGVATVGDHAIGHLILCLLSSKYQPLCCTGSTTQQACICGVHLQVMMLKPDRLGASLNSQTGSVAELGVPAARCLHRNFLVWDEMNSSLSAVEMEAATMPSSALQSGLVALANAASGP
jgi:hypothetical protein